MKICFVISDVATEPVGTSVVLMRKAHQRGHEVYVMNVGGFNFYQGAPIKLTSKLIPKDLKTQMSEKAQQRSKTSCNGWAQKRRRKNL